MPDRAFWERLDALVAACGVTVDRPRGSRHPRYPDFIYPFDYGYLTDTATADGGGIDLWYGATANDASSPRVTALICNVDLIKRDAEIKLLLDCAPDEMRVILSLHNTGEQSAILIVRET